MAVKFTDEQQRVIDTRNKNILVSAAAGSGKTAVLTERILRLVCDELHPVDIDRLLVVTFTNAAAAEMRERIRAGLMDRLRENPGSAHIQRQSVLIHNALITTIDSFSLFILRNHFHEIGLDPAFRVADEGEIRLLEQDTLAELLEDRFRKKDESFLKCVEFFCPGGKEKPLEEMILNLSRYASSFPWPEEWLEERKNDYSAKNMEDFLKSGSGAFLIRYAGEIKKGCLEKWRMAIRICEEPDGPYMYAGVLNEEATRFEGMGERMGAFEQELSAFEFARLPSKKDDAVSAVKRELVKKIRNSIKDLLKDLQDDFFSMSGENAFQRSGACGRHVETLSGLAGEFDRRMTEKKREAKIVSFSDIEHMCLNILLKQDPETGKVCPTAVAKEYRQYFYEVLIDEYQDSNLVQEYILKAVSGEEEGHFNRFMVGDVKQSIYKFRLARPELFIEKYENYRDEGDKVRIDLARNFRSREQVIRAVNGIFGAIMDKDTGGVCYDEKAALYAGAQYPAQEGCESELVLVEPLQDTGVRESEAKLIAEKIRQLKADFLVTDRESGIQRPAKYSDMVILLRSNAGWDEEFKKVLELEGIPVHITSKTGYFSATEIQNLLQFLRVLDNPYQDIPFFCAMKSVFGGFSDEELAVVRECKKEAYLYENVREIAKTEQHSLREKCVRFLEKTEKYRLMTAYLPIRELLQRIVEEHHYLEYVAALPAGGRRKANVEMLYQKASDFEKTSFFGLFHFVRYIEQLEKYEVDFGEAESLDENADLVRIMSIHKSKGLEFPIVFAAGLAKRFNMQDISRNVIVDMDLGLGCDFLDIDKRIKDKTLRKNVIAAKLREDNLAEEMRVLYVALTRAKEKLIMTACVEKAKEYLESFSQNPCAKLSYADFITAGSYLDFLMPVVCSGNFGSVKVTAEELTEPEVKELQEQSALSQKKWKLETPEAYSDPEKLENIKARFNFNYPFAGMEKLYTKTTVSELKIAAMADQDEEAYHSFEETEIVPYIPQFAKKEEKHIPGTVRGSAFHRAMELLDFEALYEGLLPADGSPMGELQGGQDERAAILAERLHGMLLKKCEEQRLSQEYFEALKEPKIVNFLMSGMGIRMWRAQTKGKLYREQPFVLGIEADRLIDDIPAGETVLIQGIIDVFFVEEDGIVLLDYKTDVIDSMEALYRRYETQLDYYAEAINRITGLPVKEKILYSFYLEK